MSKVPIQCNCKQQYVVSNILIIIATHNLLSWGKGGEGGEAGEGPHLAIISVSIVSVSIVSVATVSVAHHGEVEHEPIGVAIGGAEAEELLELAHLI